MAPPNFRRFPGQRQVVVPRPVMRPGFRGVGATCAPPGSTGAVTGPIPIAQGGNAVQGKGIAFFYDVTLASLANGVTSSAIPLQFDANSSFVWLRSTFAATIAHAAFVIDAIPVPNITVNIQDTGKGASFMNAPVPVWQMASIAPGLPYPLAVPQLIQANASFTWTFANYDAAVTYTDLHFTLHGFRVFDPGITDLSQVFGPTMG